MAFTREFFSHPIARLNVICWGDFQSIFIFFQLTLWLIAKTFVRKNKPFVREKLGKHTKVYHWTENLNKKEAEDEKRLRENEAFM